MACQHIIKQLSFPTLFQDPHDSVLSSLWLGYRVRVTFLMMLLIYQVPFMDLGFFINCR